MKLLCNFLEKNTPFNFDVECLKAFKGDDDDDKRRDSSSRLPYMIFTLSILLILSIADNAPF